MDFKTSFCWRSTDQCNDDIISAYMPGLKTGMDFRNQVGIGDFLCFAGTNFCD